MIAGMDRVGGGSWLELNSDGLVAVAMNRHGTLEPQTGNRSRGELVLKALKNDSATVASAEQLVNRCRGRARKCSECGNRSWFRYGVEFLHALPATRRMDLQPVWLFAVGQPDLMTYEPVSL